MSAVASTITALDLAHGSSSSSSSSPLSLPSSDPLSRSSETIAPPDPFGGPVPEFTLPWPSSIARSFPFLELLVEAVEPEDRLDKLVVLDGPASDGGRRYPAAIAEEVDAFPIDLTDLVLDGRDIARMYTQGSSCLLGYTMTLLRRSTMTWDYNSLSED